MAKGGFTGAVPPRETSPEDYSGVWDITEQYGEQKAGSWPFQADDCAPKSLRFNGSNSNLEKTFVAEGSRTAWTWSCWLKRGRMNSGRQVVFGAYNAADDSTWLEFGVDNDNAYYTTNSIAGSSNVALRDPAAFYHYFANFDGATFKIFINNVEVLSSTSLAGTRGIAGRYRHRIGQSPASHAGNIRFFDGVMAECHFLDGQVLSPSDFAFYDGQGIWQPKRFTGDYSSGPVYSNQTTINDSTGATLSPGNIFDGDTSTFIRPISNDTIYEGANADDYVFRLGNLSFSGASELKLKLRGNSEGYNYIWFNDDISTKQSVSIGNSAAAVVTVTSLPSTITAISLAGPNTGTGNFGLSIYYLELDGIKLTDASVGRNSFHLDFSQDELGEVKDQSGLGNNWTAENIGGPVKGLIAGVTINAPSQVTLQTAEVKNMFNGNKANFTYAHTNDATNYIQWAPTGGYPTNGHIWIQGGDGNGAGANTMEVQINGSVVSRTAVVDNETYSQAGYGWGDWHKYPVAGNTLTSLRLTGAYALIRQLSTVDDPTHSVLGISDDNDVPAITDTLPSLTDYFVDSPVNGNEASTGAGGERRGNYATLNPLKVSGQTIKDGSLACSGNSGNVTGTIYVSKGKYYWEFTAGTSYTMSGIESSDNTNMSYPGASNEQYALYGNGGSGQLYHNGSTSSVDGFVSGDVIGVALDMDEGKLYFYKNGSAMNSGNPAATGLLGKSWTCNCRSGSGGYDGDTVFNFGQKAFSHAAPAGYSPLATSFLPEPSGIGLNPSKALEIALWTGSGSTGRVIPTEIGADLIWIKKRNATEDNVLIDTLRGANNFLMSNSSNAPNTNGGPVTAISESGFTIDNNGYVNGSSGTYVGWLWDAGTTTTSVAVGGSNSLAYDQSQTWSGLWTGTAGYGSFTNLHDADDTDYAQSLNATLTFPSTIALASLEIRHSSSFGTATLSINGTDVTSQLATSGTKPLTTIKGFTSLTSISMSGADYQANVHTLYEIFVNGRKLVDNGVTVASVPGTACDVRANPEAGFSIVKVDNPNSTEARVHGLSKAPEFIVAKALAPSNTQQWHIFHSHYGKSHYGTFTSNSWSGSDQWGSQEPNASTFFVKTNTGSGANFSGGMIYYIWHAVENYSAMGSYVGNGLSNGPLIHLGWEPKWLMIKGTGSSKDWRIYDATREPFNEKTLSLHASNNYSETHHGADEMDFLSNGFKIRSTGTYHNQQDQTYLYVAFAANPFVHARAH